MTGYCSGNFRLAAQTVRNKKAPDEALSCVALGNYRVVRSVRKRIFAEHQHSDQRKKCAERTREE